MRAADFLEVFRHLLEKLKTVISLVVLYSFIRTLLEGTFPILLIELSAMFFFFHVLLPLFLFFYYIFLLLWILVL